MIFHSQASYSHSLTNSKGLDMTSTPIFLSIHHVFGSQSEGQLADQSPIYSTGEHALMSVIG